MATDNFNRANGALGSNWTDTTSMAGMGISSNQAIGNHAQGAYWNVDTPSNDQYSQIVMGATLGMGAACRVATGAMTMYVIVIIDNLMKLYKIVAGAYTELGSDGSPVPAAGNVQRIEAEGPTIRAKLNGALGVEVTDSAIPSGRWGIAVFNIPNALGDDWEGGNLAAGISMAIVQHHRMRNF